MAVRRDSASPLALELLFEADGKEERQYIECQDQAHYTLMKIPKPKLIGNLLKDLFFPQEYPSSVSNDYLEYQLWDSAQAFFSTICGTLATQEVLRGIGVGEAAATPLAATVTWVLKDGCGHISRIFFAYTQGNNIDAYSKKWRLYADFLNDAAMCVEICLPHFGYYSWTALCASTVMKSIVGVAGGASRVAMTHHHAQAGNFADVAAKDAAQETAVNLIASFVALLLIYYSGGSFLLFLIMASLHLYCNYKAVSAVCLRTLNEPRFLLTIDQHLQNKPIGSPEQINGLEPLFFRHLDQCISNTRCNYQIHVGTSIKDAFTGKILLKQMRIFREVYSRSNYILVCNMDAKKVSVLVKQGSIPRDILRAYFHAVLLAIICSHFEFNTTSYLKKLSAGIRAPLRCFARNGMDSDQIPLYSPSRAFQYQLNNFVDAEWPLFRTKLIVAGWDVSKCPIPTGPWRVTDHNRWEKNHTSENNNAINDLIFKFLRMPAK